MLNGEMPSVSPTLWFYC